MDLTPKQLDAIEALLTEKSKEAATRKAGVPRRTLDRWLKTAEFREALRDAGDECLRHATAVLSRRCVDAAATLTAQLSAKKPAPSRIAAADKILAHAARLADAVASKDRLAELAAQVAELRSQFEHGGGDQTDAGQPPAAPPDG